MKKVIFKEPSKASTGHQASKQYMQITTKEITYSFLLMHSLSKYIMKKILKNLPYNT